MRDSLRALNRRLTHKGLRVWPLRWKDGRSLIYVYRPAQLDCDLRHNTADRLLRERGYCMTSPEHCLRHLMQKLHASDEFPHEIGLFLGYPPEDVDGFIVQGPRCCKCVGTWCVYGDEQSARKTFAKHQKCIDVYCAKHREGCSIEKLCVMRPHTS